jgi:5-methylcytosine-specific restriction endonuclease McrA
MRKKYVRRMELAELLGLSPRHIHNLVFAGLPSRQKGSRLEYPWPDARHWYSDYKSQIEARRRESEKQPSQERHCECGGGPLARYAHKCDQCKRATVSARNKRWREEKKDAYRTRRRIPDWTAVAKVEFERGVSQRAIALQLGVSTQSVSIYRRLCAWDLEKHRAHNNPDQRLDLPALQAAYEGGLDPVGMSETSFRALAKRQDWDSTKRWDAIWTRKREGMDKKTRDRMRGKEYKQKRRSASDGTLTPAARAAVYAEPLCFYCAEPLTEANRTLDHIDCLDTGGLDSATNAAPACHDCNSQ